MDQFDPLIFKNYVGPTIGLATQNQGKICEFSALFNDHLQLILPESGIVDPEETEDSFMGNAQLKANYYHQFFNCPVLSDDSGLVIPALNGEPGVHSARWAGQNRDFLSAITRIQNALIESGHNSNSIPAYFVSALVLILPCGTCWESIGELHGTLTFPPRSYHKLGLNAYRQFGYNSIFIPHTESQTLSEINETHYKMISGRTKALINLTCCLSKHYTENP